MNIKQNNDQEDLRSFLLMSELEHGEPISQREIASRLGIALGLVNSYLKALSAKGFVTVKAMPRNRYAYLLTPKGFAEKSRLAFQHLSNFNKLYRVTRQESLVLFERLYKQEIFNVDFCGVDDLSEIFYLSLQEAGLKLRTVMESKQQQDKFFGRTVLDMEGGVKISKNPIILTSLQRADELQQMLIQLGVSEERIFGPTISYQAILSVDTTADKYDQIG